MNGGWEDFQLYIYCFGICYSSIEHNEMNHVIRKCLEWISTLSLTTMIYKLDCNMALELDEKCNCFSNLVTLVVV